MDVWRLAWHFIYRNRRGAGSVCGDLEESRDDLHGMYRYRMYFLSLYVPGIRKDCGSTLERMEDLGE